jgi:hypothetical protein
MGTTASSPGADRKRMSLFEWAAMPEDALE